MGVGPEKSNTSLLEAEKLDINKHLFLAEKELYSITNKLNRFNTLCKKYEEWAGTQRGEGILRQMAYVKKEIQSLSRDLMNTLDALESECKNY